MLSQSILLADFCLGAGDHDEAQRAVFCPVFEPDRGLGLLLGGENAANESDPREELREQTIYIPYEKLRRTFEQQGRGVFLPYEKFQELWQAARDAQPKTAPTEPPVQAIITEISNQAEVRDDALHVRAELKIDLLGKGWIEVPLRLKDAALLSARVGEEPARVVSDPGGGHRLLWNQSDTESSQIELQLEYARAITKAPARNSVEFDAPLAPVNRWRIRIPEAGVKVNVHPLLAATEVPADDSAADSPDDTAGTVVLAFVGAAPIVRIDWTPRAEGATGLDALVSVQAEQEFVVDQGVTRTRTAALRDQPRGAFRTENQGAGRPEGGQRRRSQSAPVERGIYRR